MVFTLLGPSCSDDPAGPSPVVTEATRDFEAAWTAARQRYPLFEFKRIDWDSVHAVYRPRAEAAEGLAVYELLHDLIAELKDAHAWYRDPISVPMRPFLPRRIIKDIEAFDLEVVKTYFDAPLLLAGHGRISHGVTDTNIGYMHISTLAETGMMDDFDAVMDSVRATRGLVIDIRGNLGGFTGNTRILISRFIEDPLPGIGAITRDGPVELDPFEPDTAAYAYINPVVLLVNGASVSAPEMLAELMRQLPNVTLVGDTTAGAGCWSVYAYPGTVTLPSGKVIFIPTAAMLRLDGHLLEWNGILPDIRIGQTAQDITAGRDFQLETAFDALEYYPAPSRAGILNKYVIHHDQD